MPSDTTLDPIGISLSVAADDGHLEVIIINGTYLSTPQGAIPIPVGIFRLPIRTKKDAKEFHEEFGKAVEAMPEDKPQSDLVVVGNVKQADNVAQAINKFT